jgi:hypothetical protein
MSNRSTGFYSERSYFWQKRRVCRCICQIVNLVRIARNSFIQLQYGDKAQARPKVKTIIQAGFRG